MSTQDRMPAWLAAMQAQAQPRGHRATAGDRAKALAAYELRRAAAQSRPAAHGRILASLRAGDMSPLARQVFGLSR